MQIIIIGGGLTGLVAAYEFSKDPANKVIVFDKENELGGMLRSYGVNNYRIEEYYHHIFSNDTATIALLKELSLEKKLIWRLAKNGYYINGKIYETNTPLDFLKLPEWGVGDLISLGLLTLKIKSIRNFKPLDEVRVKEWVIENSNNHIWDNFISPLLQSKFGKNYDDISAAWFIKRLQIRSNRKWKGETLGYLEGGFWQLIEGLKNRLKKNGGQIHCGAAVNKIIIEKGHARGVATEGKEVPADKIIFTGSGVQLRNLGLGNIIDPVSVKYQGTICVLLSLKKKLAQNLYWLNIKDRDIPFRAYIEHTNFMDEAGYNNEHLVYLSYYFQDLADPLAKMGNAELIDIYCTKLKTMFPGFDKSSINWWKIKKEFPTAPVYEMGYFKKILPYETKIDNIFLAGINSMPSYPERSINGSIVTGEEIYNKVMENKDQDVSKS